MTAAERWADDLAAWAIPAEIIDQAPECPWGFPPRIFAEAAKEALGEAGTASVSTGKAREALDGGGTVLDVGVGGGAASLPLAPPAMRLTGVDQSAGMLTTFTGLARERGVEATVVQGVWPDVAGEVPSADVVVCHHVFYNVADLVPFVLALTERARRRVVVELTATHPQAALNSLWKRFWDLDRPTGPGADLAFDVVREAGLAASIERWEAPPRWHAAHRADLVGFIRRRLCLPPERDPDIEAAVDSDFELAPRSLATIWWPGAAP